MLPITRVYYVKEAAERQRAIVDKGNIDVLVGSTGASSMWNVRR